jgi:hypothetical protein
MATDTGLFGPSPWEVQQAQQQAQQQQLMSMSKMDSNQLGKFGLMSAGAGLGDMLAAKLGGVNPALQHAQQSEQIFGQGDTDLSTSAGLMAKANQFRQAGDLRTAMALTLKANELKKQESKAALEAAQANLATAREEQAYQRALELERSDGLKNLPPAVQAIMKLASMKPTDPGYAELQEWVKKNSTPADVKDATSVAEFKFAQSPEGGGFKGSYTDWLKTKAQSTHITVSSPTTSMLDQPTIDMLAEQYLASGTLPAFGMGKDAAASRAAVFKRAAEMGTAPKPDGTAATPGQVAAGVITGKQDVVAQNRALGAFASGVEGRTVRSLNTAVDHLSTLSALATQLDNTNLPVFNRAANYLAQATGSVPPSDFDAARKIVSNEVNKAIITNNGSQKDRDEVAAMFDRAKTPAQLQSAIHVAQKLLSGQLMSLEQQFVTTTGRKKDEFRRRLTPGTITALGKTETAPAAPPPATDFNTRWATLKSGQSLVGPDGKTYTKK